MLTASVLILALQVGPNPSPFPEIDPHSDLRDRPQREQMEAESPTSRWLAECLEQIETDPARAHAQAQIRRSDTTGADQVIANHCLGLAATQLGLWDDARTAFQDAKNGSPAGDKRARARFGTMAGNAALAGGNAQLSLWLLDAAEQDALSAASATLQALAATDKARALVALDRAGEALAALETATRLEKNRAEGWLLKATLLRRMEQLSEAQPAIERAAEIDPLNPEIGLEAGLIAVLAGREDAARQSWQSVIDTQPDSLAAQTAADYLTQIGPAKTAPPAIPYEVPGA